MYGMEVKTIKIRDGKSGVFFVLDSDKCASVYNWSELFIKSFHLISLWGDSCVMSKEDTGAKDLDLMRLTDSCTIWLPQDINTVKKFIELCGSMIERRGGLKSKSAYEECENVIFRRYADLYTRAKLVVILYLLCMGTKVCAVSTHEGTSLVFAINTKSYECLKQLCDEVEIIRAEIRRSSEGEV